MGLSCVLGPETCTCVQVHTTIPLKSHFYCMSFKKIKLQSEIKISLMSLEGIVRGVSRSVILGLGVHGACVNLWAGGLWGVACVGEHSSGACLERFKYLFM